MSSGLGDIDGLFKSADHWPLFERLKGKGKEISDATRASAFFKEGEGEEVAVPGKLPEPESLLEDKEGDPVLVGVRVRGWLGSSGFLRR